MKILITMIILIISTAISAYDFESTSCPSPSDTDKYIEVPMFYDLNQVAKVENIGGLNIHEDHQIWYEGKKFKLYYELVSPYDSGKELLIMIPGGPGQSHTFIHDFKERMPYFKNLTDKFNVFVMDHRGLGCSRYYGPGDYPAESLLMRQAASDIDAIRKSFGENVKINVWGYSYGSFLAQTYALLYPDNLNKLFLGGAFSAATDFVDATKSFEQRVLTASPEIVNDYLYLKALYPEYAAKLMKLAVGYMYNYTLFKKRLVDVVKSVMSSIKIYELDEVEKILKYDDYYVMEWMMRSIACIEIFPNKLEEDMFPIFYDNSKTCAEFVGMFDHFNYTGDLVNISAPTFIWGGELDHVTPAKAMRKMSKVIPNNYLYIDQHIGHGIDKPECFMDMVNGFFDSGTEATVLDQIKSSSSCVNEPEFDEDLLEVVSEIPPAGVFVLKF